MKKKVGIRALGIFVALSLVSCLMASASDISPQASYYLCSYYTSADAETNGRVLISFDVNATRVMNEVGASYIVVQEKINGTWRGVASYFGSTDNGMLEDDTSTHSGSITYDGTAGNQYRALVTVYAGNDYGSDSRTVATNSVTAE
jgi:hypothetical protein